MKFLKNELEREGSRARINRDRSSQEDREREWARLKERRRKWFWTMPWSRASQEGNEKIPNNAVNQREQEPKKGREIPKKLTQRAKEISKLIPVTKLMYRRASRNSHIIHQVIHKRNQRLFVRVFRNITQRPEKVVDSLIRRKDYGYFSLHNFCCKFYRDDLPWLKWIANLR